MDIAANYEMIPVDEIELDLENPRIRKFLEMYGDSPTSEQIYLALGAGSDDHGRGNGTTFEKLKQSILTNRGIIHPVILNRRKDGSIVCIEGNTRVALYKELRESQPDGPWNVIRAIVQDDLDHMYVHAIRLQAHLVGPRPWDPYSKAKYLNQLRNDEHLPFGTIVDYSGGNQYEIERLINAYVDMEKYYRPVLEDEGDFDATRFSGFVELQKPNIKQAIIRAGYTLSDFANWIRDDKLNPLRLVRVLPKILANEKAHKVFIKDGARKAESELERPSLDKNLQDADLNQLARALIGKMATCPFEEFQKLKNDPTGDTVNTLLDVKERLEEFLVELG